MKIFYLVTGLLVFAYLSLYLVQEKDDTPIIDNLRNNPNCSDDKINRFGIKEGILNTTFLSSLVGAFWGAAFTVEKEVGKWWSKELTKKAIIKIICTLLVCGIFTILMIFIDKLKNRFELLFVLKIFFHFFESYCIFGLMPLFFQYIKYNDNYVSQSYEKINIKLTNEDDVQLFRKSIFIYEKKRKKDIYVDVDKVEENEKIIGSTEDEKMIEDENIINNTSRGSLIKNDNKEDITMESSDIFNINNENKDEKKENEPSSPIIKNIVEMHEDDDEGDLEFYIDGEKMDNSKEKFDKLKEDLINHDDE
jgi:hypothetical protein